MTHAKYITQDLRHKILTAGSMLDKLTLAHLAGLYGVSVMPVRVALETLIREKMIIKSASGRLFINPQKLGSRPHDRTVALPPKDWYLTISADLIHLSLRGEARTLTIPATAERYGIGRTAVQTIFTRLAALGILNHASRRGWSVRTFADEDLKAYLDVREMLELRALDLSRSRLNAADLRQMLELNRPGNEQKPAFVDNSLHWYWIERSQNRYIREFYTREGAYYRILYEFASTGEVLKSKFARQHRRILEALLKKDWREASAALSLDIRGLLPLLHDARQSILRQPSPLHRRRSWRDSK